jgi:N-acyl homoserine lactone hydrolase
VVRSRLFEAPFPAFRDWDRVFARAPRSRLTTLVTGHQQSRGTEPIPVISYLLERPTESPGPGRATEGGRTYHLIDAGLDARFADDPYGSLRGLLRRRWTEPFHQRAGDDLASQLERMRVESIRSVFFTHVHFDRTSGLSALPYPIHCLKGRAEAPLRTWPFLYVRDFDTVGEIREFTFEKSPDMPPLGPCIDIFGDGSMWAAPTPGHTLGHVSYVVMTDEGPLLLTGDATPTRQSLETRAVSPHSRYRELALNSLERLGAFVAAYPQVRPLFGRELPPPGESCPRAQPNDLEGRD